MKRVTKTKPKTADVRSDVDRQIGQSNPIPPGFYSTPYPLCNEVELVAGRNPASKMWPEQGETR